MSWFRQALMVSPPTRGSLYTVVDPGEFYEWRFTGEIPKGTVFSVKLPPSEVFTQGMLIASAEVPASEIEKKNFGHELRSNIKSNIVLHVGQIQTPKEIIEKFQTLKKKFNKSINDFKTSCDTRRFIHSSEAEPSLYKVKQCNADTIEMESYGVINAIMPHLYAGRKKLYQTSNVKKGRAYELDALKKYDQALTFFQNSQLYSDPAKLEFMFQYTDVKPLSSMRLSWKDCFMKMSKDACATKKLIDQYGSLQWIKETLKGT